MAIAIIIDKDGNQEDIHELPPIDINTITHHLSNEEMERFKSAYMKLEQENQKLVIENRELHCRIADMEIIASTYPKIQVHYEE